MVRQCAWCLRLIDSGGERVSQRPLPKLYEATHGMCCVCGTLWIEQAVGPVGTQAIPLRQNDMLDTSYVAAALAEPSLATSQTVAQLVLDLQQREREKKLVPDFHRPQSLRVG
jgi:hypothetical protein